MAAPAHAAAPPVGALGPVEPSVPPRADTHDEWRGSAWDALREEDKPPADTEATEPGDDLALELAPDKVGDEARTPTPPREFFATPVPRRGPGAVPIVLIVIAMLFAATAIYLHVSRESASESDSGSTPEERGTPASSAREPGEPDQNGAPASSAGVSVRPIGELHAPAIEPGSAAREPSAARGAPASDANPKASASTGSAEPSAVRRGEHESAHALASAKRASVADRLAQARVLVEEANDAIQEGQHERALRAADASLALRRTARGNLARAKALQRLGRVEDALAAVTAAERIAPKYATVYELRGRILWATRRRDEARVAFERFLELEPTGQRAAQIQKFLGEPR